MSELFQFPEVVVVEASAGSGKTYALAKRYVQLALHLAKEQSISILAITFTNKATWEMKSRILDFLKRIALQKLKPFEVGDILLPIGLDEQKASHLGFVLMEEVIHQYHYFHIQTIDSFINTLLSGCSFKIGLSAQFKIKRNSRDYLQLALDELLESAKGDKGVYKLFENFVHQYLFLENRWGWFPKEDLLNVMVALFRPYNTFQKPLLVFPCKEDLFAKKRKIYALILRLQESCPLQTNKNFINHLEKFLQGGERIFDVDELKTYWSREDFPINKGGIVTSDVEDLWTLLCKEIHDLCWLESRSMFNAYIELFQVLLAHFHRLSKRDDVLFLEELNRKAAVLFDDELVSVDEIYFRLASRFRHYLVDEFQDTSLAQWRNVAPMVEEALSADGSLFYVGDKKQAIYAFRGGESRLFDALQSKLASYVRTHHLEKNFRSCPNIIDFNNQVFDLKNLRAFLDRKYEDDQEHKRDGIYFNDEDFMDFTNTFGHARQSPGKDLTAGVVRVSHLSGHTKAEYTQDAKERLITLLRGLSARFSLQDIAILTRGNDELEEITQWLLQEGIAAQSERNSDIKNNPLIAELIEFLKFLHSPIDNNAFAQFCLGELLPRSSGLTTERLQGFLFECARRKFKEKDLYFYREFREQFPQEWERLFEPFVRQVGIYPLYELATGIIARFNCEAYFPVYQGFLMHFLQLIKTQEEQSCDLAVFLDYYEKFDDQARFVAMPNADAVHILTVHKAKGLEFPVVIIPFLEMDMKVGSGGRDGAQSYVLDIEQEGIGLVRLKESYRTFCPQLQAQFEAEYKKAFLLELNIMYVALTRAIEELYVFIPERSGSSVNNAKFLIPQECLSMGNPLENPRSHQSSQKQHKITSFVDDQWLGRLKEEFLTQEVQSLTSAREGEIFHELLSHIAILTETNSVEAFEQAWGKISVNTDLLSKEYYQKKFMSLIESSELKKFFYLPEEAKVFCEKEFVNAYGDTKRLDRLIIWPLKIWIIDYKASRLGVEQHKKQMLDYMNLMKGLYPKEIIEGFIVYLDDVTVKTL